MENLKEKFETFGALLEEHPERYAVMSFEAVCKILDTNPVSFDKFIYGQVGMTGEEVMELYRKTSGPIAFDV